MQTIFGKHRDVIGKSLVEVLPEIKGQGFLEILDSVYRTGEPYTSADKPI